MRKEPLNLTADPEIRASFQARLAEARETPGLSRLVRQPAPDLYFRYSGYYQQLCQLPRRVRRALQGRWKRSLSALALLVALGQTPALAATINVDGTKCNLAEAIRSANTNAAVGGCSKGSGADTLVLAPKSTHTLTTVEDTTHGDTGLPLVTSTITIAGNDSTIERGAGSPNFRLLAVTGMGKLTLENLTLRGGYASFPEYGNGGGVLNFGGTLTLTDCTVSGNNAQFFGGGLYNSGTLTLNNSTVSGNTASSSGGGVFKFGGTLTLTNSTVSGNSAYYEGGGMFNHGGGTLTLRNSTVSSNTAGNRGGGVYNSPYLNTLTVINSTISGNTAGYHGGGVLNGGILTLTNSTVSGNTASSFGGGVHNGVSSSPGIILTMNRSLISGNSSKNGSEVFNYTSDTYYSGTVHADDFNLFGHNGNAGVVGFSPGPTNIVPRVSLNRILAPLAANGGPTLTRALVRGSPAIDAVRARCLPRATDQRGLPRPVDGDGDWEKLCDIGAFEFDRCGVCASARPSKGCTVNGVTHQLCRGTADDDTIVGTSGNDVILGRGGHDVLNGLAGHDLLCGGQDNDLIGGGADRDNIEGNDGKDKLFGGQGKDWIKGGRGNDYLSGGSGKDRLDGQQGTDTCVNGESVKSCP